MYTAQVDSEPQTVILFCDKLGAENLCEAILFLLGGE